MGSIAGITSYVETRLDKAKAGRRERNTLRRELLSLERTCEEIREILNRLEVLFLEDAENREEFQKNFRFGISKPRFTEQEYNEFNRLMWRLSQCFQRISENCPGVVYAIDDGILEVEEYEAEEFQAVQVMLNEVIDRNDSINSTINRTSELSLRLEQLIRNMRSKV